MGMNKFIGLALLCAFAWIAAPLAAHTEEMTADQYAARAVQSVKDGKQDEALADFNKAVELAPDKAIHYRNRAAFYALTKQWDKALEDYDTVLKLDKDDLAATLNRGLAYVQLGRLKEAAPDFEKVLKADPGNERALKYLSYVNAALKKSGDAVENLTQLIEKIRTILRTTRRVATPTQVRESGRKPYRITAN